MLPGPRGWEGRPGLCAARARAGSSGRVDRDAELSFLYRRGCCFLGFFCCFFFRSKLLYPFNFVFTKKSKADVSCPAAFERASGSFLLEEIMQLLWGTCPSPPGRGFGPAGRLPLPRAGTRTRCQASLRARPARGCGASVAPSLPRPLLEAPAAVSRLISPRPMEFGASAAFAALRCCSLRALALAFITALFFQKE